MKLYVDASALVKLLIRETGSGEARALWDGADRVVSARAILVESHAAIARRLDRRLAAGARRELARRLSAMNLFEVDRRLLDGAAEIAGRYRLRALDSVHLAAALEARDDTLVFATWDAELAQAALSAGLRVAP